MVEFIELIYEICGLDAKYWWIRYDWQTEENWQFLFEKSEIEDVCLIGEETEDFFLFCFFRFFIYISIIIWGPRWFVFSGLLYLFLIQFLIIVVLLTAYNELRPTYLVLKYQRMELSYCVFYLGTKEIILKTNIFYFILFTFNKLLLLFFLFFFLIIWGSLVFSGWCIIQFMFDPFTLVFLHWFIAFVLCDAVIELVDMNYP